MSASEPTYEEDLDVVIRTGAGRRVLAKLIKAGLDAPAFSSDPLVMAYHAGLQQVARSLDAECRTASFEAWLLMQRETYGPEDA